MVSQNYYATEKLKRKIKTGLVVAATGIAAMTAAIGIGKSTKSGESGDSGNKAKIVHVQQPRRVVHHEKEVIERERVVVVKDTRELAQAQAAARAAQARAAQAEAQAAQAMQIAQEEANKRALEESLRKDETDRRMAAEQAAAQARATRSTTVIQLNTVLKTGSHCGGHRMRGPHKNWYRR